MKELQEKYKDDKQRLNQEMMKLYQENKVNPFASCLPLLAQLPVFLALFYLLRDDLRDEICPEQTRRTPTRSRAGRRDGVGVPLHPGHHGRRDGLGADRADRPLRRLAAAVEPADAVDRGPQPAR